MTVGEKIKKIRKERGLTQKQLGLLITSSEGMIRQYELGLRNPKIETIDKIALALGVQPFDLMGIAYHDAIMDLNVIKKQLSQIEVVESYLGLLGFSIKCNVTKWHWEDDSKEVQIVDDTEYILSKDGYSATFTQKEMDKLQVETKELIEGKFYKKLMKG